MNLEFREANLPDSYEFNFTNGFMESFKAWRLSLNQTQLHRLFYQVGAAFDIEL